MVLGERKELPRYQLATNDMGEQTQDFSDADFSDALAYLRQGKRVARGGWNGKGMYLALQTPDEHSKMRRPYIYMSPVGGELVPWVASQTDLLATDWYVVEE